MIKGMFDSEWERKRCKCIFVWCLV